MKVKILSEKILHGRDAYYKDEIREVPEDVGVYFCTMGWAQDPEGKIKTGERKSNRRPVLSVEGGKIKMEDSNNG